MRTRNNIKLLAFVSLFNDFASEATLRLLPLFLAQVLGAGTEIIGLIEGVAESTATLTKLVSGWISDRLPRRKPLVVAGYAVSSLTKPLLLIANHWTWVLFVRFSDRLGKGVRNAPRDALIADESHESRRGHSFGLNRALDTLGAVLALVMAYLVLQGSPDRLTRAIYDRIVLWAIGPAVIAVLLVAFGVREAARPTPAARSAKPARAKLPAAFWRYMAVLALFTLSNSSDAFLVLKASHGAGGVAFVTLCLVVLNLSSAALAIPAGKLSDRIGRKKLIVSGWLVYATAYAGFAIVAPTSRLMLLGNFFLYGAFYGLAEGVEKALIADLVPEHEHRGFAYGVFSFVVGVMIFPASLLFGIAEARWGETTTFLADAALAVLAAALLVAMVPEKLRRSEP